MTRASIRLSVRCFNSGYREIARGVTDVDVGSGALLGRFIPERGAAHDCKPRRSRRPNRTACHAYEARADIAPSRYSATSDTEPEHNMLPTALLSQTKSADQLKRS